MTWTKPVAIGEPPRQWLEEVPQSAGVYRLLAQSRSSPIKRLARSDQQKVLYIGSATKLRRRFKTLVTGLFRTEDDLRGVPHPAANLYMANYHLFKRILPAKELRLTWMLCRNPEVEEQELIRAYFWKFGETPFFNRAFRTHDKKRCLLHPPPRLRT